MTNRMGFSKMTKEDLYYDGMASYYEEYEICETTGEIISVNPTFSWDDEYEYA